VGRASNVVIDLRDGGPAKMLVEFEYKESQENERKLCKMTDISVRQFAAENGHSRYKYDAPDQCEREPQDVEKKDQYESFKEFQKK